MENEKGQPKEREKNKTQQKCGLQVFPSPKVFPEGLLFLIISLLPYLVLIGIDAAIIIAVIILEETMASGQMIGAVMIIGGAIFSEFFKSKNRKTNN